MEDLIARLEKSSGPDRELDESIALTIFDREERHIGVVDDDVGPVKTSVLVNRETKVWVGTHAPEYTASLDAAVALKPEDANCYGFDLAPKEVEAYWSRNNVASGHWVICGYHPTSPAIALCIAALKARLP